MNISVNKIIGSLIYKTREALNKNDEFMSNIMEYYYSKSLIVNDKFNLWHYPGTPNEISNNLLVIGKHLNGYRLKFPSVFNFQPIRQERAVKTITAYYNLAFVAPVLSEWTTEERENQVFVHVLRPIYDEFFNQIKRSGYFENLNFGMPSHSYYEVFTTGNNSGVLLERYGDHIDAIEVHDLMLPIKSLCDKQIRQIEKENLLVTENIKQILNSK